MPARNVYLNGSTSYSVTLSPGGSTTITVSPTNCFVLGSSINVSTSISGTTLTITAASVGNTGTDNFTITKTGYVSASLSVTVTYPTTYDVTFKHYCGTTLLGTTSNNFTSGVTYQSSDYATYDGNDAGSSTYYSPDVYINVYSNVNTANLTTTTQLGHFNPYWTSHTTPSTYQYSNSSPSSFNAATTVTINYSRVTGTTTEGSTINQSSCTGIVKNTDTNYQFVGYYANTDGSGHCFGTTEGTISDSGSTIYSYIGNGTHTIYAVYKENTLVASPTSINAVYNQPFSIEVISSNSSSNITCTSHDCCNLDSTGGDGYDLTFLFTANTIGSGNIVFTDGNKTVSVPITVAKNTIRTTYSSPINYKDSINVSFKDALDTLILENTLTITDSNSDILTYTRPGGTANYIVVYGHGVGIASLTFERENYNSSVVTITVQPLSLDNSPVIEEVSTTNAAITLNIRNNNSVNCAFHYYLNGFTTAILGPTITANSTTSITFNYTESTTESISISGYFSASGYNNSANSITLTFYRPPADPTITYSLSNNDGVNNNLNVDITTSFGTIYYRTRINNGTWSDFNIYSSTVIYLNNTYNDRVYDIEAYAIKNNCQSNTSSTSIIVGHTTPAILLSSTNVTATYPDSIPVVEITNQKGSSIDYTLTFTSGVDCVDYTVWNAGNLREYVFTYKAIGTGKYTISATGFKSATLTITTQTGTLTATYSNITLYSYNLGSSKTSTSSEQITNQNGTILPRTQYTLSNNNTTAASINTYSYDSNHFGIEAVNGTTSNQTAIITVTCPFYKDLTINVTIEQKQLTVVANSTECYYDSDADSLSVHLNGINSISAKDITITYNDSAQKTLLDIYATTNDNVSYLWYTKVSDAANSGSGLAYTISVTFSKEGYDSTTIIFIICQRYVVHIADVTKEIIGGLYKVTCNVCNDDTTYSAIQYYWIDSGIKTSVLTQANSSSIAEFDSIPFETESINIQLYSEKDTTKKRSRSKTASLIVTLLKLTWNYTDKNGVVSTGHKIIFIDKNGVSTSIKKLG